MRLPQDVGPPGGDRRGVPDFADLDRSVGDYAAMYELSRDGGVFGLRTEAVWGLVARWPDSRSTVEALVGSKDLQRIEDAAGVLMWVGCPDDLVAELLAVTDSLPDSVARDAIEAALPQVILHERQRREEGPERTFDDSGVPLAGAREPFTKRICFVEAAYDDVVAGLRQWHAEIPQAAPGRSYAANGTLRKLLDELEPWEMPGRRQLIAETVGRWTAIFDNGSASTTARALARTLCTRSLETVFSPHVVSKGRILRYGATVFTIEDGARDDLGPLHGVRSIHVSRQSSRWEAHITGEVQPYEDTARYEQRRVRDRFDLEMLNAYCEALGIRRADASFYGPRGLVLVKTSFAPRRSMPSARWRAEHAPD